MPGKSIVLHPSTLADFVYCPRLPFFNHYRLAKPGLKERLRLLLGKLYHFFKLGFEEGVKDELIEVDVKEVEGVKLAGRPDCYRLEDEVIILEEVKSGRAPRRLGRFHVKAWDSDVIQALAYAYMLQSKYNKQVLLVIRYRDGAAFFNFTEELRQGLIKTIIDYRDMVNHKLLFDVKRTAKCSRCRYDRLCELLEEELAEI